MINKVKIIGGHRAGKTIFALQEFYEHGKMGALALSLYNAPEYSGTNIGFRCASDLVYCYLIT